MNKLQIQKPLSETSEKPKFIHPKWAGIYTTDRPPANRYLDPETKKKSSEKQSNQQQVFIKV